MARVLIGMGSNIEPAEQLNRAAEALRNQFGAVRFSSVYRSAAIGMDGDDFYNACCLLNSELPPARIKVLLKGLEDEQGRDRSEGSWRPRTIDLDLLWYDGAVIDDELYRYAHAYVPAAELIALELPEDGKSSVTLVELRL